MLTEEHLQDAVKCDGSRARCNKCSLLSFNGAEDCIKRLAETAIKLKAELETEKNLHHKYEKLALKNAMGYDEVKAERDKAVDRLQISPYGDDLIDQLEESIGHHKFHLETLQAERDAAVKDLTYIHCAGRYGCEICLNNDVCKRQDTQIGKCIDFKWRGIKE